MSGSNVRLRLQGRRELRATLDENGAGTETAVVACPPHPEFGGDRHDGRLRAVSEALDARGIDCLRFDYGPWTGGEVERADAETALAWATERYDRVGLFGYSVGGAVALVVAADTGNLSGVSVLAPATAIGGRDTVPTVEAIERLQVIAGERDETVDCARVAERASDCGGTVEFVPADHFFVGQRGRVATLVAAFLADSLGVAG